MRNALCVVIGSALFATAIASAAFLARQRPVDATVLSTVRVGTLQNKECINCQSAPAYNCNRCEVFPAPWVDPNTGIAYNSLKCDKNLPLKCCAGTSGTCNDFSAVCKVGATEAYTDKFCTLGHMTFAIDCTKSTCNTLQ